MPKLFTKKWIFSFLISFSITFVVGFFLWNIFITPGSVILNKVLGEINKIGSNLFLASFPQKESEGYLKYLANENIVPEAGPEQEWPAGQDLSADENLADYPGIEDQNPIVETSESVQDQLDNIQEKLDIISKQVQELIAGQTQDSQLIETGKDKNLDDEKLEEDGLEKDDNQDTDKINKKADVATIYPKVLISEVQVSPIEQRFIELYNPNDSAVDLTGWYLQRKIQGSYSFESLVSSTKFQGKIIMPSGYFVISRTDSSASILLDNLTLSENNTLVLKNPNGEISDTAYTVAPISETGGGGGSGPESIVYSKILISEIKIAEESGDKNVFIELYNPNGAEVDLTGWYIFRNNSSFITKTIMEGKKIPANNYFLLAKAGSIWDSQADLLFDGTLNENDGLSLKSPDGNIADEVSWSQIEKSLTLGRKWDAVLSSYIDADNNSTDLELSTPTPKEKNIKWIETPVPTLLSILITTPANKLVYTVGEALDITGLVVTGTYGDNSTQVEAITISDVAGFDSSLPVIGQVLTITFGGQTITYTIDINEVTETTSPSIITYTISELNISPNGDGIKDSTSIDLEFSEKVNYKIYIELGDGMAKEWSGSAVNPREKIWDGKNASGSVVPDGIYTIKIKINGLIADTGKTIIIDTIKPIITLNGEAEINLIIGTEYTELGAITDDGSIVTTAGSVDFNTDGIYTITYTATDIAGNSAVIARKIIVEDNRGDANNDGKVDYLDYATLKLNFGRTDCSPDNLQCNGADINRDGSVDASDMRILVATFGII